MAWATNGANTTPWVLYADGNALYVISCEHCAPTTVLTFYTGAHQGDLYRRTGSLSTDRIRVYSGSSWALIGDYVLKYEPFTTVDACDEGGAGDDPDCCTGFYEGDTGIAECSATTAPATVPTYALPPMMLDWTTIQPSIPADGVLQIAWGNGTIRTHSTFRWVGECNADPDRRPQGTGTGIDACCNAQWSIGTNEARPSAFDPQAQSLGVHAAWGGRGIACGGGLTTLAAEANATVEAGYSPVPSSSFIAVSQYSWAATYVLGKSTVQSGRLPWTLEQTMVPPGMSYKQVLPWRTTVSPGVFEWHAPTAPVEMVWLPSPSAQQGFEDSGFDDTIRPAGVIAQVLTGGVVTSGDSGGPKFVYFGNQWWYSGSNDSALAANGLSWHSGTRWDLKRLLPAGAFQVHSAAP